MFAKLLFLAMTIIMLWPGFLVAQDLNKVAIFGIVTDGQTGKVVSGVVVEAINEADTTQKSSAVSDASGRYQMNLVTSVAPTRGDVLSSFRLLQNYPNPFNPSTVIGFEVSDPSDVRLVIYNMLGQRVRTLVHQRLLPGEYSFVWDATDDRGRGVAAGLYFYQLRTEGFVNTKKMVLLDGNASGSAPIGSGFSALQKRGQEVTQAGDLMVTIRAKSPRIQLFEQRSVLISNVNFRFDIGVTVTQENVLNKDLIVVSEPGVNGKIFISGLARAVIDTVIGTEKVSLTNERTQEEVAMRVNYDGGFPLMSLSAAVGDPLTIALFTGEQRLGESEETSVADNVAPRVIAARATNGDKDIPIDSIIFIDFSEPIDTLTVDDNSFFLADSAGKIPGRIGFLNDNTTATFDPDDALAPLTTYTLKVTTDVLDLQGNNLVNEFTATFTTGDTTISGGQIAFTQQDFITGEQGLYLIDDNGDNLVRLTKRNDVFDSFADWSPDGTKIVFSRGFGNGNTEVMLMNSDGTFLENLIQSPLSADFDPAFSPDGNSIVFVSNRDGNREIYKMGINGTNQVNLTNTPDVNEFNPAWSPDGNSVVFVVNDTSSFFAKDILLIQSDGTNRRTIIENQPYLWPAWSPDGNEIAFVSFEANGFDERLLVTKSDGSNPRIVTIATSSYGGASWSPDGKRLVFIRPNEGFIGALGVVDRNGSNDQIIAPESYETNFDIFVWWPAWAPKAIGR